MDFDSFHPQVDSARRSIHRYAGNPKALVNKRYPLSFRACCGMQQALSVSINPLAQKPPRPMSST